MHVHRRMIGGKIERGEVEPLGFDLGTYCGREAEAAKDLHDFIDDPSHRMFRTHPAAAAGHGEIFADNENSAGGES
jgi:hypothetical protein